MCQSSAPLLMWRNILTPHWRKEPYVSNCMNYLDFVITPALPEHADLNPTKFYM